MLFDHTKIYVKAGDGGKTAVVVKPDAGTAFENKEFGFTLTYPGGWNKQALDQKGVALALELSRFDDALKLLAVTRV